MVVKKIKNEELLTQKETCLIIYDWLKTIIEQKSVTRYRISKLSGYNQGNLSSFFSSVESGNYNNITSVPSSVSLMRIAYAFDYKLPIIDKKRIEEIEKKLATKNIN